MPPCHTADRLTDVRAGITPTRTSAAPQPEQTPVQFIEHFDAGYLHGQLFASIEAREPTWHPFFSQGFLALLEQNRALCAQYRGDDICGFTADGDIYLNTQEAGPTMNFATSGFTAKKNLRQFYFTQSLRRGL